MLVNPMELLFLESSTDLPTANDYGKVSVLTLLVLSAAFGEEIIIHNIFLRWSEHNFDLQDAPLLSLVIYGILQTSVLNLWSWFCW